MNSCAKDKLEAWILCCSQSWQHHGDFPLGSRVKTSVGKSLMESGEGGGARTRNIFRGKIQIRCFFLLVYCKFVVRCLTLYDLGLHALPGPLITTYVQVILRMPLPMMLFVQGQKVLDVQNLKT